MGFEVRKGVVIVNHSHNEFAVTSVKDNPTSAFINGLEVHSAFSRKRKRLRRGKGSNQRVAGDNCPMIYALKGKDDLTTNRSEVLKLNANLKEVIKKFAIGSDDWDLIVSLPSSHSIGHIVARRLQRAFGNQTVAINNMFRKKNIFEARAEIKSSSLPVKDKRYFEDRLSLQRKEVGWGGPYSLKGIFANQREKLSLLVMINPPNKGVVRRVLLVDDVVSSGTTLNSAKALIEQSLDDVEVQAFCLFSASGAK
ncbi:hypothetical protein [Neptuniibacter sp. 1_MG-2023]|uniref:hypothetical protein n=1 Tax=Neptuniibacter sp. 1_MG-2023 TaxID=3062662 RepID=UPI0026E282ED|nr:hypothetical protein [Neptuniibacter sp. 1_MG-2023]MDO6594110.1 hypothetical protein [Neptuniibacter sp. 1_MG-2023]